MRKLSFILLFLLSNADLIAQVGIGTNTPDNSAMLEVNAMDKGLLPPRLALTSTTSASPITSPATGLLVFNTATAGTAPNNVVPGYYYWSGSAWIKLTIPTDNAANVSGTVALSNGGTGATTAAGAITNLGATTVGGNLFTLSNPSAVTFPRLNADNTVTALSAADFRTAIGAGTSSTSGTVTSVGLSLPSILSVSGSPVTSSGTLSASLANQNANLVFAGPASGSAAAPTFRTLVAADIPTLNQNTTGTASNVTGIVAVANGGTGSTTAAGARTNLGATTVGGNLFTLLNPSAITFPRFNADNTVTALSAIDFRTAIGAGTGNGTVTSIGLTTGTTGDDVNVSGSPVTGSGTITLNIPDASATARGLVSTSAQTFEGTKTFRSAPVLSTANASQALFTDVNRNVISNAISGTGSVVMSNSATLSSPTLTLPKINTSSSSASAAGAGAMRYSTSSGGVLEYSNGIAWNTLTSTVTKALVIANKSSSQNFPNNTPTAVTSWSEITDNANAFNPSTGVFTAPRTGNYVFSFSYAIASASYGTSGRVIEAWMDHSADGSSWNGPKLRKQLLAAPVNVTTRAGAMINFVINLNAGESIRPVIWHDTGSDRSLETQSQFNNISIVEL